MFKLGKRKAVNDPRTLKLANYVSASRLPSLPDQCNYTGKLADYPMYDNDKIGCCAIAGPAHQRRIWTANDGALVTPSLEEVVRDYSLIGGYQPGVPGTDNGCILLDVMRRWRTHGIVGGRISAFASVDPQNHELTAAGIFLFGGLTIGLSLPAAVQSQTNDDEWRAPGRAHLFGPWSRGSWGGHCLVPGTRVLTADLQWRPIESFEPGAELVGFDEAVWDGKCRKYRKATVVATELMELPCYDLEFADGTTFRCSEDHMWLTSGSSGTATWLRTDQMRPRGPSGQYGTRVCRPLQPWTVDTSRDAGYLAAAFDGEGWIDGEDARAIHKLGYAQRYNEMLAEVQAALSRQHFEYGCRPDSGNGYGRAPVAQVTIHGRQQLLRFLGSMRPHRLLASFDPGRLGAMYCEHVPLLKCERSGTSTVVALQTTTGTFIAEGFASHNCVTVHDYDERGLTCITWGGKKRMSWNFYEVYCDEAFAALGRDWVGPDSKAPNGFDAMALARDLGAL